MREERGCEVVFEGYVIFDNQIELPDGVENIEPRGGLDSQLEFRSKEQLIKIRDLLKGIEITRIDVFIKLSHDDVVNFFVLIEWLRSTQIRPYVINLFDNVSFNGGYCDDKNGVLLMFELKSLSEIQYLFLLQELPKDTVIKNIDGYNLRVLT